MFANKFLPLSLLLITTSLFAQELPISTDYTTAIQLTFTGTKCKYGPTLSPKGFGNVNEIKACDKQDIFTFEKEHNSAWYEFTAPKDGDLIFEITPSNSQNDYDFLLYKYTDTSFYQQLLQRNLLPIMCNLARTGKGATSVTGLYYLSSDSLVPRGTGNSTNKPLQVKKGERFVLVLDNVYPKGKGHTINMYYLRDIILGGTIQDENKQGISASVRLEDARGRIIGQVISDTTGNFSLETKILDTEGYSLIYSNANGFPTCLPINSVFLSRRNFSIKDIVITLPKITEGKKYVLTGINFQSPNSKLIPSSAPILNNIAAMMQRNTHMHIQIEGHVNSTDKPTNSGKEAVLGNNKAKAIYDFLIAKGIAKERIAYKSYGSLYMIYPRANSQKEIDANNRIEVFVTKM